jgi:hypothetical protein
MCAHGLASVGNPRTRLEPLDLDDDRATRPLRGLRLQAAGEIGIEIE